MYWLDPDGGSHSNTFLAYRDMTSYSGGWTMCYTTDNLVPRSSKRQSDIWLRDQLVQLDYLPKKRLLTRDCLPTSGV